MRTPSPLYCRLDLAPPLADQFICGVAPSITARYFSACPSDSTSRWTPCPPEYCKWWLQVRLGCVRLSLSCPFRLLHTFHFLRPATYYRRFWIQRPSSERRRDLNPPDQCAAQRKVSSRRQAGRNDNVYLIQPGEARDQPRERDVRVCRSDADCRRRRDSRRGRWRGIARSHQGRCGAQSETVSLQ